MESWSKPAKESRLNNTEGNGISFGRPFAQSFEILDAPDCHMSDEDQSLMSISNFQKSQKSTTLTSKEKLTTPILGNTSISSNSNE